MTICFRLTIDMKRPLHCIIRAPRFYAGARLNHDALL
jgi:hypothetical protein